MSSYRAAAYDPDKNIIRTAWWIDDYFGKHKYGVQFDAGVGRVYEPSAVQIPLDVEFVQAPVDE